MPGPKSRNGGLPQAAAAQPRSGAQELDRLLGTIRRRRAEQLARERAAGAASSKALLATRDEAEHAHAPRLSGSTPPSPAVMRAGSSLPPAVARGAAGVVLEVQALSPSLRIFRVARPKDFVFEAGQSVKLGLEPTAVRRRYSIASSPHEEHLEFCVERVPGGRLSSRLFELTPGDRVSLAAAAKGKFLLRTDRRVHVMVATGTGIAPLRSMLRQALSSSSGPPQQFWVLHGASYADELPYGDELAALARSDTRVHYLPTVSRPGTLRNRGWAGQHGRVDALVLPTLQALRSKDDVAVYACGNPQMVRAARELLEPLGYLVLDEAFD